MSKNKLAELKGQGEIDADSVVTVTSHPIHNGGFFSGWFGVTVGGHKVLVYGSTPAHLGAWEAKDRVKKEVESWLRGEREFCPQAR